LSLSSYAPSSGDLPIPEQPDALSRAVLVIGATIIVHELVSVPIPEQPDAISHAVLVDRASRRGLRSTRTGEPYVRCLDLSR
jgi:hypothetical protein